jgi:hypothetical protein
MIDLNKTYQTKEGHKVKLAGINKDADILHQLIGWVYFPLGISEHSWDLNGISSYGSLDSLVEVPQPKVGDVWESHSNDKFFICAQLNQNNFLVNYKHQENTTFLAISYVANNCKLVYRDEDNS